jgi:hypothetical protein
MQYDAKKKAYVDEDGREIAIEGEDAIEPAADAPQTPLRRIVGFFHGVQDPVGSYKYLKQKYHDYRNPEEARDRRDREMAEMLQNEFNELDTLAVQAERDHVRQAGEAGDSPHDESKTSDSQRQLGRRTSSFMNAVEDAYSASDAAVARAMQAMEFEMANELLVTRQREDGDFTQKEYAASGWKAQMFTVSTLLCIIQVRVKLPQTDTIYNLRRQPCISVIIGRRFVV